MSQSCVDYAVVKPLFRNAPSSQLQASEQCGYLRLRAIQCPHPEHNCVGTCYEVAQEADRVEFPGAGPEQTRIECELFEGLGAPSVLSIC
jgi:hypothetical protein